LLRRTAKTPAKAKQFSNKRQQCHKRKCWLV
jgi:hypothetical protein